MQFLPLSTVQVFGSAHSRFKSEKPIVRFAEDEFTNVL